MSSLVVLVGLIALVGLWFFYFRYWHVGFGMVLIRKESDGTVWVASRLLRSPSGKAGVKLFSQVAFVDGILMSFPSNAHFEAWARAAKPKRGQESVYIFVDGTLAQLAPALIKEKIPVYWSPNMEMDNLPNRYVSRGLRWCNKTGQYIHTRRISREILREVFYG